jgi:superfamily II DNA/RNA helicase
MSPSAQSPSFAELGVPQALCDLLNEQGITSPFPIQTATLGDSLSGRDVLGRGRTGSGKTLAFALPVITRLVQSTTTRQPKAPRALILAPTRELALQIEATLAPLAKAMKLRTMSIFGGVNQNPQVTRLREGVDVVIACPGRLEDLLNQRALTLSQIEITVLDEADHMAELGFLPPVTRLMNQTPKTGQRMLFSATLDGGVKTVVDRFLTNPVTHSVDSEQSPVSTMEHYVLHVRADDRLPVLLDLASAPGKVIIFTRMKHRAKQLAKKLNESGVPAVEMQGNLSQPARVKNLAAFADGRATALVATDIAARGIHIDDVRLVIHADPPLEHKAYLHRSGRTARAGADGTVVTLAADSERKEVAALTRAAGISPRVSSARVGDPILQEIAPGERTLLSPDEIAERFPVTAPQTRTTPRAKPKSDGAGSKSSASNKPRRKKTTTNAAGASRGGPSSAGGVSASSKRRAPRRPR